MPQVGFKPMVPWSERSKTVHALDRTATVICRNFSLSQYTCKYTSADNYTQRHFTRDLANEIG
jgi:hypothetical protein